jgi:hypothetical protein
LWQCYLSSISPQGILKNADTIIIENDKSAEQSFKLVKQVLAEPLMQAKFNVKQPVGNPPDCL